ncbi:aldehyde dehydrogenase [Cupriavidus sp. NPDC089707]|uniref:aldehyde dehydrogenase n=1 Tax=Cupriavidus sp. NPDC089707 TaxID=3363963 RepID=UPI0038267F62
MQAYNHYIGGEWVKPTGNGYTDSKNPFDGQPWVQIARGTAEDADAAVDAAHAAFRNPAWAGLTPTQRGKLLARVADLIERDAQHLAELETRDNGKLFAEMHAQTRYIPEWFRYFGGLADKIQGAVIPLDKKGYFNFTRREPLGVIVAITPWNSPLLLLTWKLAPLLAAGNTVVIKPSEHTSVSTLELARLFDEAGFPPGVVNVVTGFGAEVGERLVTHPKVSKIAFTGSDANGKLIYQTAAASLKKVSLELGGKSPNIVFEDADFDQAINGVLSGIFAASGQTCIAGSRLLVQRSIYKRFLERLAERAATARLGNPMQPDTQVGPVTTEVQLAKVLDYIEIGKAEGAVPLCGGKRASGSGIDDGWFVEPTIFADVDNSMRIAQEEIFGPVLSAIPFDTQDDAIRIANDSIYGLGAGVWTQNIQRAFELSEAIESGMVWVNTYRAVSFMSPFGGYKQSGIGRESGIEAIDEYLQTKSVWIAAGATVDNPFIIR